MNNLKCPNCGQVFSIDDAQYAALLQQVRTAELQKEVQLQVDMAQRAAEATFESRLKDAQIKSEQQLREVERKYMDAAVLKEQQFAAQTQKLSNTVQTLESENVQLKGDLRVAAQQHDLAVQKAVLEERQASAKREADLQAQLDYYKDLKTRMSTKAVGESLEQYCAQQFERARQMGAFRNAYFGKDNVVSPTGSKGDFIYREMVQPANIPLISIMFEMKNEMDTTATKHKNEDFFKELDKDRKEKNCEYAVLVSLLEADNDVYNDGIVDVSHLYPKMYVVRPQYFIPMISILRNAALGSVQAKLELKQIQHENADLVTFERNIEEFKNDIFRNQDLAQRKHADAIAEIDGIIAKLQKMKEELQSSDHNMEILANKVNDKLTIRKLAKGAPSIAAEIESYRRPN